MLNLSQSKDVLLVEDLPSYQDLVREAFEELATPHCLHIVQSSEDALDFLAKKQKYAQVSRPALILLDLNLPRMTGHELLAILKADSLLKLIPVVIFTTSNSQSDIFASYALQANCYVTKPTNLEQFFEVIQDILTFWLTIAQLPPV